MQRFEEPREPPRNHSVLRTRACIGVISLAIALSVAYGTGAAQGENPLFERFASSGGAVEIPCPDDVLGIFVNMNRSMGYLAFENPGCLAFPLRAVFTMEIFDVYLDSFQARSIAGWEGGAEGGLEIWSIAIVYQGLRYSAYLFSAVGSTDYSLVVLSRFNSEAQ